MDPKNAAWLWGWWRLKHGALALTMLQNYSACKQTTQPECRKQPTRSLAAQEKLSGAHDPQHALQKNGGLADPWYMDDRHIMCHPILVPSFLQEIDVANAKVEAERNPQKTEVTNYVNDLDAAPP